MPDLSALIALWIDDPTEVARLTSAADTAASAAEARLEAVGPAGGVREAILANVAANLAEKKRLSEEVAPFPLGPDDIARKVIGFEAFRLETFVTSGVYPRRYFGFVDGRYDTRNDELRLIRATTLATAACNAWLADEAIAWRVTDAEIAVTFLAESGALYLGAQHARVDALHPVFDVGLDDLASGDGDLGELRDRLDAKMGTGLGTLVERVAAGATSLPVPTSVPNEERWLADRIGDGTSHPYLVRYMNLEEAIAGTALMYVWEKKIAADGLAGQTPMEQRTLDEQFVIASLVYNSGKLHSSARWKAIQGFSTGEWLHRTSEDNAHRRPRLPVLPPAEALSLAASGQPLFDQPTSWLGTYHILQRYGGFAALFRFSDTFDAAGAFRPVTEPEPGWFPDLAEPAPPPPPAAPPAPPLPASPGCATTGGGAWAGLLAFVTRRRASNPRGT